MKVFEQKIIVRTPKDTYASSVVFTAIFQNKPTYEDVVNNLMRESYSRDPYIVQCSMIAFRAIEHYKEDHNELPDVQEDGSFPIEIGFADYGVEYSLVESEVIQN